MAAEFFQTQMGSKFYGGTVPRIAEALEGLSGNRDRQGTVSRIADALEAGGGDVEKIAKSLEQIATALEGVEALARDGAFQADPLSR